MYWLRLAVFCAFLAISRCIEDWTFPPGFKFGAASSAYQVEGAWNVSGKGENIWDRFTHTKPELIKGRANGNVTADSYNNWQRDIDMAGELGVKFYRFSISWTRLLPTGFTNSISEDGTRYYNNLIDGLLAKGIEPIVTIYHWDLPQSIQDLGGWINPLITNWYLDYARIVFTLFGDRVKTWITINEPIVICDVIYNTGNWAPGIRNPDAAYVCNKNVLIAHAKAYRLYDREFRSKYHGQLSFTNLLFWFEPWMKGDEELAELAIENCAGRYSHPVYSTTGGWPPSIEKALLDNSKRKGHSKSKLPAFTQEEIELVRGTYDFYAMNYYTTMIVRPANEGEILSGWPLGDIPDLNAKLGFRPEWNITSVVTIQVAPEGIRRQLNWLKNHYGDLKFAIMENGYPDRGGLRDQNRINFFKAHLKQLLLAIKEDGVNVTHFTAWSLMDNFEWIDGYEIKFGLYEVNFTDPLRTRTARDSARYYAKVIKNHKLDD